jgi:XTP/dITP diphosphohydrolase
MKIVLATSNAGKIAELKQLLPSHAEVVGLSDVGLSSPPETGATFEENALLKARAAVKAGDVALADDSGLEVDALDGRPGVRSARYAGEPGDDARNNAKLLAELSGVPASQRSARFRSAVALVTATGREIVAEGAVDGRIVMAARGSNGFGYDALFEISDPEAGAFNGRTLAELRVDEKNRVSHRARAYQALLRLLERPFDTAANAPKDDLSGWRTDA